MYQKGLSFIKDAVSNPDDLDHILKTSLKTENKYYKSMIIFTFLILLYSYTTVNEKRFRYDSICEKNYTNVDSVFQNSQGDNLQKICNVSFELFDNMEPPIYFFYELKNFYQNHRKYMRSFSYEQFQGKIVNQASDCSPATTNEEMNKYKNINGKNLNKSDIAFPCGLIAKTFFNDSYQILFNQSELIEIREKDLVPDLKDNIKKPSDNNYNDISWIDITNEHFLIWMKVAVYPKFRKLWGMIDTPLKAGEYIALINDSYPIKEFSGEKYIVISTKGILGFKNLLLVVGYFIGAFICCIFAGTFFYLHRKNTKNKAE